MKAIGIIETRGFAAAIEAADAAVKSANVELLGYELSRGAGQVTVKLEGDVSAITAAVEAGSQAASSVNQVVATLIMGRPHDDIWPLVYSPHMVGLVDGPANTGASQEEKGGFGSDASQDITASEPDGSSTPVSQSTQQGAVQEENPEGSAVPKATCNLCHDPKCPRIKGEPHANCIHNTEY